MPATLLVIRGYISGQKSQESLSPLELAPLDRVTAQWPGGTLLIATDFKIHSAPA